MMAVPSLSAALPHPAQVPAAAFASPPASVSAGGSLTWLAPAVSLTGHVTLGLGEATHGSSACFIIPVWTRTLPPRQVSSGSVRE